MGDSGSIQFLEPGQIYLSPVPIAIGIAKIAPWCLARRDRLSAKEPGQVTGVTSPLTLSAHTRNRYVQAGTTTDASILKFL